MRQYRGGSPVIEAVPQSRLRPFISFISNHLSTSLSTAHLRTYQQVNKGRPSRTPSYTVDITKLAIPQFGHPVPKYDQPYPSSLRHPYNAISGVKGEC
jgi:hypothetical protein